MKDKHIEELEELFAIPIGLELEATVDGLKLYSSQRLKESFLKSLGSSGRVTKYFNQIEKLVLDKKILVPCYLSKNLYRLFKHKVFGSAEDKSALGFYHTVQKRVFILIDNNTSAVGTAKNDFIASTTIHECVHLYSDRMRSKFISLFKDELERYYISCFSAIFSLNKKPDVMPIINFLSKFEYDRSIIKLNNQLIEYYNLLEKQLKKHTVLKEVEFINRLKGLIVCVKLSLTDFSNFIRMYRYYRIFFESLDRSYKVAFGKRNTVTTPYQELSSASEIISVLSEIYPGHPKIVKMFKDMA